MNIITEPVVAYLDGLYAAPNAFLEELRAVCEENLIPIILRDAEGLILQLLRIVQPTRILEIGTAVGYSALCFAGECPKAKIVTLELSEGSAAMAKINIQQAGYEDRIRVLQGDAKESLLLLQDAFRLEEQETGDRPQAFDFVFIDAAKGHYKEFWDGAVPLMSKGAVVISDNVLFKGMTASDQYIPERRQKTITNRMRSYLKYITNLENVKTVVLPVGDGVAVSIMY